MTTGSSWTPIEAESESNTASSTGDVESPQLTGDAALYEDLINEHREQQDSGEIKGKGKAVMQGESYPTEGMFELFSCCHKAYIAATSETWSKISDFEELPESEHPIPTSPGPSNWIGQMAPPPEMAPPPATDNSGVPNVEESEARQVEVRMERRRQRRASDAAKPPSEGESSEIGSEGRYATFTLAEEVFEPIGPVYQVIRIRLSLARNMDQLE